MAAADTRTLTALIEKCFDLAMDERVAPARRRDFLVAGKRLRGCLVNLLSARFDEAAPALAAANAQLAKVDDQVTKLADDLHEAAAVLKELDRLVSVLDALLKVAAAFH